MNFTKLSENAFTPTRGSDYAAGLDLYSAYDYKILPFAKKNQLILTDIKLEIPLGYYGRIASTSGLSLKKSIEVGAGVIDSDYRGNIGVILYNFGNSEFIIRKGDKIAQIIIEKITFPELVEVRNIPGTKRGHNGFGSTNLVLRI